MVDEVPGSSGSSEAEQIATDSEVIKDGWERTLEDMEAMAEDREEKGFYTVTIPTADTAPKTQEAGDTERWGLSYLVPDNYADDFRDVYEGAEFDDTGVYQVINSGYVFQVVEYVDADAGNVLLAAASYRMRHAPALVRQAVDRGKVYTHFRTLDRTHLGGVEHDDVSAFFPEPEDFYAYEM